MCFLKCKLICVVLLESHFYDLDSIFEKDRLIFEKIAISISFDFHTGLVGHAKYFRRAGHNAGSPGNAVIGAVALSTSSCRPPLLKSKPMIKCNTHEFF